MKQWSYMFIGLSRPENREWTIGRRRTIVKLGLHGQWFSEPLANTNSVVAT